MDKDEVKVKFTFDFEKVKFLFGHLFLAWRNYKYKNDLIMFQSQILALFIV